MSLCLCTLCSTFSKTISSLLFHPSPSLKWFSPPLLCQSVLFAFAFCLRFSFACLFFFYWRLLCFQISLWFINILFLSSETSFFLFRHLNEHFIRKISYLNPPQQKLHYKHFWKTLNKKTYFYFLLLQLILLNYIHIGQICTSNHNHRLCPTLKVE